MKKIGLVLSGGGGRGAYQIGVWKALRDTGLDKYITSVSGASVGGLNAALFIQNDLDKAQSVWESISMGKILTLKSCSNRGHERLSFFETDGLDNIIKDNLDMRCFDNCEYNCWLACVRTEKNDERVEEIQYTTTPLGEKVPRKYIYGDIEYFNLKYVNDDETRKRVLLASSAMPFVFPKEEIEGHKYLDGGARLFHGDNVPVRPLYEIDKCDVILIIHLAPMDKPVDRKEFPSATFFEIFPKENLGKLITGNGMFGFTAEGAKRRKKQGYDDNYALFQRIKGIIDLHQDFLDELADAYVGELQIEVIRDGLEEQNINLMKEYEQI